MIALGILFIFLALIAMVPPILVILGHYPGHFFKRVELFVSEYDGILISLGTLFLVSFLALLTTFLANKYADLREASNRKIQSELKLSEFRQDWINALRSEFAGFVAILDGVQPLPDERINDLSLVYNSILLRVNHSDPDFDNLIRSMTELLRTAKAKEFSEDRRPAQTNLTVLMSSILKREWDRLKFDMEKAQAGGPFL